eukprot:1191424-Prorocentrum_minimum.AAC.1
MRHGDILNANVLVVLYTRRNRHGRVHTIAAVIGTGVPVKLSNITIATAYVFCGAHRSCSTDCVECVHPGAAATEPEAARRHAPARRGPRDGERRLETPPARPETRRPPKVCDADKRSDGRRTRIARAFTVFLLTESCGELHAERTVRDGTPPIRSLFSLAGSLPPYRCRGPLNRSV